MKTVASRGSSSRERQTGSRVRPCPLFLLRLSATFALNSGEWLLSFDISDLLLVEDQQKTNCSLHERQISGGSSL